MIDNETSTSNRIVVDGPCVKMSLIGYPVVLLLNQGGILSQVTTEVSISVGDGMDLSLLNDPKGIAAHNGHGRELALPDTERRGP
jgi:hypothetical protein